MDYQYKKPYCREGESDSSLAIATVIFFMIFIAALVGIAIWI